MSYYTGKAQGVRFNKSQTEFQLYPEEYFSGADVTIYFNDVFMDEITGLSFKLEEKVTPQFGYASKTWDWVLRGKRFVQGYFKMSFREAGYLFTVLDHIGQQKKKSPAMGYMMKGDPVPKWHGQVKQNIEQVLNHWHAGAGSSVVNGTKAVEFKHEYEWPRLEEGMKDTGGSQFAMSEKRHGQSTAIKQLQARLLELGYGFKSVNTSHWKKPKYHNSLINYNSMPPTWVLAQRYTNDGNPIGGSSYDFMYPHDKELQARLNVFLKLLKKDLIAEDGHWKKDTTLAMREFLKLSGYTAVNGQYIDQTLQKALAGGLVVNGIYDLQTKMAVKIFQANNGIAQTGIVGNQTAKALAPMKTRQEAVTEGSTESDPRLPVNQQQKTADPRMVQYEKEIWGRPFLQNAEEAYNHQSYFYRTRFTEVGKVHTQWLFQNGIDVYINYGPVAEGIQANNHKAEDQVSFNTTVKAIRNMQIYDVAQELDANTGQPINEIYYFIAKDLD